jgi:sugar-specific transcriptional regulator TrmB
MKQGFFMLLKGKPKSATEIAKESKLIRNSIYDTLKSFLKSIAVIYIETNISSIPAIDQGYFFDKIEKEYSEAFKTKLNLLKDTQAKTKALYKQPMKIQNVNELI